MKYKKRPAKHKPLLKVYVTKNSDGIVKVWFGKKPVMYTTGFNEIYWQQSSGVNYDIITEQGAYYYSEVLKELFKGIAPNVKCDKPLVFILSAEKQRLTLHKKNNK